jgi:hypothetical protein
MGLAAKERLADAPPNLVAIVMLWESTGPSPSVAAQPGVRVLAAEEEKGNQASELTSFGPKCITDVAGRCVKRLV